MIHIKNVFIWCMDLISVNKSSPGAPMFKNKKQNHTKSTVFDAPVIDKTWKKSLYGGSVQYDSLFTGSLPFAMAALFCFSPTDPKSAKEYQPLLGKVTFKSNSLHY